MKKYLSVVFFLLTAHTLVGQNTDSLKIKASRYFNKTKAANEEHVSLWDKNLYGPFLLVNPASRKIYANYPDTSGILKKAGDIYTGSLPTDLHVTGAYVEWGGRTWAMLPFPLPPQFDIHFAVGAMTHELFHASQPSLGFERLDEKIPTHLNEKDGRIYLRLELEALKSAVTSINHDNRQFHLNNAIIFRKYRHKMYPDAPETENLQELNEGIAEYTATVVAGRGIEETIDHLLYLIESFMDSPTYVRTFAYRTIPVYGYLLRGKRPYWNKEISNETNLTNYFISAYGFNIPDDLTFVAESLASQYNGEDILREENKRVKERKQLTEKYIRELVEEPHFEIKVRRINMNMDPSNVLPLPDHGTIYRGNVRFTDSWGILEVKKGVLINTHRNKISLTAPSRVNESTAQGNGWTLNLNDGYTIIKNEATGNYELVEKEH